MYAKQPLLAATAALTLILSGPLLAQGPALQGSAVDGKVTPEAARETRERIFEAHGGATAPVSDADKANKREKVDAATAADALYHATPTEANRVARDRAEAEAARAIQDANGPPATTVPSN